MTIRDVVLVIVIYGAVPACVIRPYLGIYFWYWLGLMNPQRFTWNLHHSFPAAQYVAIGTLLGFLISGERSRLPVVRELVLMLAMFGLFTLNTFFAMFPHDAWQSWDTVMKIVLMTVMTVWLINTRQRLRGLLLVVTLSLGFFAIKAVPWGIRTGGQWILWGPEGTFVGANNAIGLAFNMTMPFMLFLAQTERRKAVRVFYWFMLFSSIFGVFLTHSRGAFLGMVAVMFVLIWRTPNKLVTLTVIGLVVLVLLTVFIPQNWFDRMETILEYEEDGSAVSRIETWKFGWELAKRRPLTGGGFTAFQDNPLGFDAHSVYFGILGEQGFPATLLFAWLILSCWFSLRQVRRQAVDSPDPDMQWYGGLSGMVQVAFVGFLVNGLTLNKQYFDLFYLLVAIVIIVKTLAAQQLAEAQPEVDQARLHEVA